MLKKKKELIQPRAQCTPTTLAWPTIKNEKSGDINFTFSFYLSSLREIYEIASIKVKLNNQNRFDLTEMVLTFKIL